MTDYVWWDARSWKLKHATLNVHLIYTNTRDLDEYPEGQSCEFLRWLGWNRTAPGCVHLNSNSVGVEDYIPNLDEQVYFV